MISAAKGDYVGAMKILSPYATANGAELQGLGIQLKANRDKYPEDIGKPGSYEFVSDSRAGQSVWRVNFIEKRVQRAMFWKLTFYRSPTGWMITNIDLTTDINKDL